MYYESDYREFLNLLRRLFQKGEEFNIHDVRKKLPEYDYSSIKIFLRVMSKDKESGFERIGKKFCGCHYFGYFSSHRIVYYKRVL